MTDLTLFLHSLAKASYLCGMVPFAVLLLGWLWWEENKSKRQVVSNVIEFTVKGRKFYGRKSEVCYLPERTQTLRDLVG